MKIKTLFAILLTVAIWKYTITRMDREALENSNQRYVAGFNDGQKQMVEMPNGETVTYCEFVNFYATDAKYKLVIK